MHRAVKYMYPFYFDLCCEYYTLNTYHNLKDWKTYHFFQILLFLTLFPCNVHAYIDCWGEKNDPFTCFLVRASYPPFNTSGLPPSPRAIYWVFHHTEQCIFVALLNALLIWHEIWAFRYIKHKCHFNLVKCSIYQNNIFVTMETGSHNQVIFMDGEY